MNLEMHKPLILLIRNAQPYDFGGGERFPVFVAKIVDYAYEPLIISRSNKLLEYATGVGIPTLRGLWWQKQSWSGVNVILFPMYVMWQLILFTWYLYIFVRLRPRVVHIQSKDDFIAATYAARLVGATVIWTDHADLKHIWQNLRIWYKNPIGKWVYLAAQYAHHITVISKSEYNEVTKHLPADSSLRSRIIIINNGCVDVYEKYTHKLQESFTFCSTNRLVTDKGVGEMITAFKQFYSRHPNSQLQLIGNGPEDAHFKKLAKDCPAIHFLGYQQDPLKFVANSHVLLQPTYHEGFSISILEAMMMKKPIIAAAVGGIPEMIDDNTSGLLIPSKDSEALLTAMERLYKDREIREKLATNARKRYLADFQFDQIVKERFIPLYENARH